MTRNVEDRAVPTVPGHGFPTYCHAMPELTPESQTYRSSLVTLCPIGQYSDMISSSSLHIDRPRNLKLCAGGECSSSRNDPPGRHRILSVGKEMDIGHAGSKKQNI